MERSNSISQITLQWEEGKNVQLLVEGREEEMVEQEKNGISNER